MKDERTSRSPVDNLIPYSRDAERAVLGAALGNHRMLDEVMRVLSPSDFYDPEHGLAFKAMSELRSTGTLVDAISLADKMATHSAKPLITSFLDAAGSGLDGLDHARIVAEHAYNRRIIWLASKLQSEASVGGNRSERDATIRTLTEVSPIRDQPDPVVDGATFALDTPDDLPAIWGRNESVLWAPGEAFFIVGPAGVGKTTIVQQLSLARIGIGASLLGLPVAPDDRKLLYIAADRPMQAQRSVSRMVSDEHRDLLAAKLVIWRGPLRSDLGANPGELAALAEENGAGTVVIDSLKDVALDLSKDEGGSRLNYALQTTLAAGVEVVALHHQRKQQAVGAKPTKLQDVYGSTWLTAGAGSVVLLWGEPGDLVVELSHLKQPQGTVGPFKVIHDHDAGQTTVFEGFDLLEHMRKTKDGATAQEVARFMFSTETPDKNKIQRARRKLDALVKSELLYRRDGASGGKGGGLQTRWYATTPRVSP